jgi:hypothetical protein
MPDEKELINEKQYYFYGLSTFLSCSGFLSRSSKQQLLAVMAPCTDKCKFHDPASALP